MGMTFCIENPVKLLACTIKKGMRVRVIQTSRSESIKDKFASMIKEGVNPTLLKFSEAIFEIDTGCKDCPVLCVHDQWKWDLSAIIRRAEQLGLKGQEYYDLFPKIISELDTSSDTMQRYMKHELVELSVSGCKTGETNAISDRAKENPWDFCWNMNELFGEDIISYG